VKPVKTLKYFAIVLVSLLILAGGSAALFVYLYPREKLLTIITTSIENATDRKVSIGNIDYGFSGIIVNDFKIYDDITGKNGFIASASEAHIRFSLLSLLDKQFTINHIALNNGKINIVYTDGTSNIERLIRHLVKPGEEKEEEKSSITSSITTIALNNSTILLKNAPDALEPLNGTYQCDALLSFPGTNQIKFTDIYITLPDDRGKIDSDVTLTLHEGDFSLKGDVTLQKCSLLWVYKWSNGNTKMPYRTFSGTIRKLSVSSSMVEGFVSGTSLLTDSKKLKVDGFARVNIKRETVFISNLDGSINSSTFKLNEFLFNLDGDVKKIHATDADLMMADLFSVIPGIYYPITGSLKGDIQYSPDNINANIRVSGIGYKGKQDIVSGLKTDIVIKDNSFKKQQVPLKILGQPCTVSVATMDDKFKRFVLNVHAERFSLDKIDTGDNGSSGKMKIDLPVELSGKITCNTLDMEKLSFANTQLNYHFKGSRLSVYSFQSNFAEGKIKGRGNISFAGNQPFFDVNARFNNIKVQDLAVIDPRFEKRFYGIADGNVNLEFAYDTSIPFLNALKGKLEFTIDKGKLVNTGIQNGLGIWLSELKYKLKDLEFSKIYGNFNIQGPNYYINSFIFNAQDIRLKLDGYFNKVADSNIKIDLEFTPDFIKDLPNPALLQLNKYKQGRWYVIPFEAKGKDITEGKNIKRLR